MAKRGRGGGGGKINESSRKKNGKGSETCQDFRPSL